MKPQLRSIIFDFDYTLADSSRGIAECLNHALTRMGLPIVSCELARRMIRLSLSDAFQALAGSQPMTRFEEFVRLFA